MTIHPQTEVPPDSVLISSLHGALVKVKVLAPGNFLKNEDMSLFPEMSPVQNSTGRREAVFLLRTLIIVSLVK